MIMRRARYLLLPLLLSGCGHGVVAAAAPPGEGLVRREVRTFDIGFLTEKIPDFPLRGPASVGGLVVRSRDELYVPDEGGPGSLTWGGPDEESRGRPRRATEAPAGFELPTSAPFAPDVSPWTGLSSEILVDLIQRNIAEDTWANTRNWIQWSRSTMRVRQAPDVLAEIEGLLGVLRARRARMVSVDVAMVPVEAVGGELRAGSPWLTSGAFDQIVAGAGDRGVVLSLTAYNGQVVSAHSGELRAVLADFEVNQTGVLPVTNPVIQVLPLGVLAEARPESITRTAWVDLRLKVIRRSFVGEPEKREGPYGEFEFARVAEQSFSTHTIVQAGGAVLAGFMEGKDDEAGSLAALARVRAFSPEGEGEPQGRPGDEFRLRVYDIGFLLNRAGASEDPLSGLPGDPEEVKALIGNVSPESWNDSRVRIEVDGPRLLVCQRPQVHGEVDELLAQWNREAGVVASVDCWILGGGRSALSGFTRKAGPGGALPDNWEPAAEDAGLDVKVHSRLIGFLGETMHAYGRNTRGYVADYECASGGTGLTVIEVPDPIVQWAGSGVDVACMLEALPNGLAQLSLRSKHATTVVDRTATFYGPWKLGRDALIRPPAGDGKGAPGDKGNGGEDQDAVGAGRARGGRNPGAAPQTQDTLTEPDRITVLVPLEVDLPSQRAWFLRRELLVPVGPPAVVEARSDGPDEEPGVVKVVRARLWRGMK